MDNNLRQQNNQPPRLCSEIQLFDLCDLDSCDFKTGRFCSNQELLSRFEQIAEDDLSPPQRYIDEELEEGDELDDYDADDGEFTDDDEHEPEYED